MWLSGGKHDRGRQIYPMSIICYDFRRDWEYGCDYMRLSGLAGDWMTIMVWGWLMTWWPMCTEVDSCVTLLWLQRGDCECTYTGMLQKCYVRVELWECIWICMWLWGGDHDWGQQWMIRMMPTWQSSHYVILSAFLLHFALQQSLEYCFANVIFAEN